MTMINANNLRNLRVGQNLTLDHLAAKSGVDRGTINKIETGKRTNPRASTIRRLAEALGTEFEALVGPDIEEQANTPVLARKTQMNFKMATDARNALSLVALRYDVRPADILHLAPLLFYWLAESSLHWRKERLDEALEKLGSLGEVSIPKHIHGLATDHWRGEEILEQERRSIEKRDLFGRLLDDDAINPSFEESEDNPVAQYLASIAKRLGKNIEFEHWSPHWSHPGYTLGTEEALELCGGDEDAAREIVHGNAPLHEMPKDVRESGATSIAKWAKETGSANLKSLIDFDELHLDIGGGDD